MLTTSPHTEYGWRKAPRRIGSVPTMQHQRSLLWRTLLVTTLITAGLVNAKYGFDNDFYNQQLLDQVDDALRPWRPDKDGGNDRQRPRFRYKGGVLVARWYPTQRGRPPQYQWSWEVPPGVNQSSEMWWQPYYYPDYYRPYYPRYCRYRYCRGYRRYGYGGYGGYRGRGYGGGRGGYGRGYGRQYGYQAGGRFGSRGVNVNGGFGGSWSRRASFDRLVVAEPKNKSPTASAARPLPSAPRSSTPTSSTSSRVAPPTRKDEDEPDADAEEVDINNHIARLPIATEEQLDAVDATPGHLPFHETICCGRYEEVRLLRQDAIRQECYEKVFNSTLQLFGGWAWNHLSCDAVQGVRGKIQCVHKCIWKARGTFDNEERVSLSKLHEFNGNTEPQQWRVKLLDDAATKCISRQNGEVKEPATVSGCSPGHLDLSYCMWEELQLMCPDEKWNTKSEYCNKMRTYLKDRRHRLP